jgi:hypothetical protein
MSLEHEQPPSRAEGALDRLGGLEQELGRPAYLTNPSLSGAGLPDGGLDQRQITALLLSRRHQGAVGKAPKGRTSYSATREQPSVLSRRQGTPR